MKTSPRIFGRLAGILACWSAAAWHFAAPAAGAQNPADPARFAKAILAFEAEDRTNPPPKDATLFVGASNIRLWKSLPERFGKQKVINRGFGGSQISDNVHFAERLILPHAPKTIYLNAGGNDLHAGKSSEQVLADFQAFVAKIRAALPTAQLNFLSIPTSPSRWSEVEHVRKANRLIEDFSQADGKLGFINFFPYLLATDGQPRAELFVEDRLHFSEAGYDVMTSVIRWQGAIQKFTSADARQAPAPGGIVFIGSSSIVRWKSLAEDFPGLPVLNRGFGGSHMFDSLLFADEILLPLKPRQVVVYAGGNDINGGKSPGRVLGDFRAFAAKVHAALPQTRIACISIAGNPARWAQVDKVREANRLLAEFTRTDPRLEFIDVFPHMLGPDGTPKPDIFVEDRLHLNEQGYAIWREVVRPFLK